MGIAIAGGTKWNDDLVHWRIFDTLFISVVFSWHMPKAEDLARQHKGPVIIGGPASKLLGETDWAEHQDSTPYDVLSMYNPMATFTTRGCLRSCKFCAVPKLEGKFRELESWKAAPIVCDNNILVSSKEHFERVIDSLLPFKYVDFNQGLDARLITEWHVKQMTRLNHVKVHFALDHINVKDQVGDAISLCKKYKLTDIHVYTLIGFKDTPADAKERMDFIIKCGALPFPMRYQPLTTIKQNSYVDPNWTEDELKKMVRYYGFLLRRTKKLEKGHEDVYLTAAERDRDFGKLTEREQKAIRQREFMKRVKGQR